MHIEPLANYPEAIPTLARWFNDEWPYENRSLDARETQLRENLNRDRSPITWVAREGGETIGTVSLDLADLPLPDYAQLTPWLASLYVIPPARGRGVGSALVNQLLEFARSHSLATLYLWTPGPTKLYERCGWKTFNTAVFAGHPIALMRIAP